MVGWWLVKACRAGCTRLSSQQYLRRVVSLEIPNWTNNLYTSNHREQEFRRITAVGSITRKADCDPRHARRRLAWPELSWLRAHFSVNDLSATMRCEPEIECDLILRTSRGHLNPLAVGLRFPVGAHRDASWAAGRGGRERARCGARVDKCRRGYVRGRSHAVDVETARCSKRHWIQCRGRAVRPRRPDGVHPRRGSLPRTGYGKAIGCAIRSAGLSVVVAVEFFRDRRPVDGRGVEGRQFVGGVHPVRVRRRGGTRIGG